MMRPGRALLSVLLCLLFVLMWLMLPGRLFKNPTSYVVDDNRGNLLSAAIAADGQWRFPHNKEVPAHFVDCITTFEDKRFFKHPGVDVLAFSRAMLANISGRPRQGGSTLTMQVVRMWQQNNSRSIWVKLKETLLAARLELSYSKKEILALYASNAPFGGNVVGLDAAAWRYYARSPQQLSWSEMATLAVLPNAPSLIHPGKNRQQLLQKRNLLLQRLAQSGKLSAQDAALAQLEPLPQKPLPLPQEAPHLLQLFKKQHRGSTSATRLHSTIDGNLQAAVKNVVNRHHSLLKSNGINNLCALVLDVETGNSLAYIGNVYEPGNKELESDVDVVQSPRSPGSALKPILYAAMLSDGMLLPNSLVPDIPTQISGYHPQNFDLGYDGAIPAHKALARSLNVPAVRLLQQYKYARFYDLLQRYGINTLNNPAGFYGLSLILGGCEVTMWDLAGMYASMARIANHQEKNKGIVKSGDVHPARYNRNAKPAPASINAHLPLDATSIYFSFEAMQEVMRPGEEGLWQQFNSSKKIAWKTGTSFGFRDGWAVGVTPQHVVAVWVGNTDGEGRAGLVGVETAAPVMFDIFRLLPTVSTARAPGGWFKKPLYNYQYIPVCRNTGFRANIDCPLTDTLKMPPLAGRSPMCPYHSIVQLDATGQYRVNDGCEQPGSMQQQAWFILPATMEFYYKQRNHDYKPLPPLKPGCTDAAAGKPMELIYPQAGLKIYVPLEIDGSKGKTIFTATHKNSNAKIFWSLNDQFAGTTEKYHQLSLSPGPGTHIITLTDDKGYSISRHFTIIEK
ncbi:MAG: penicillin-binding protein 1C [Chitinophagaceae bacterium]|nr:MAG: penicillin-binding protein 1C [Chitinophagaceae bacterium]